MMRLANSTQLPATSSRDAPAARGTAGSAVWFAPCMMRMASILLALATLTFGSQAQAEGVVRAVATASVTILDRGSGVQAATPLRFAQAASSATSGAAVSETASGNTQLTISGEVGDTLSILAPSSLTLVRNGGDETYSARTHAMWADAIGGQDFMTGGSVMRADTMKVDIGLKLTQASGADLPPGAYHGQFVVLIQYN
jgi:hypothetical protein